MAKAIGTLVDELYKAREDRLTQERKLAQVKEKEDAAKGRLIAALGKSQLTRASGRMATASVKDQVIYTPDNWDEIYAHIKETGHFDLLERRLGQKACAERAEAGEPVPGTGTIVKVKLSLTKAAR